MEEGRKHIGKDLRNMSVRLTDKEVSSYLVYRMKMNEVIHLHLLWLSISDGQCGDSFGSVPRELILGTLRTASIAWVATVVDKNGLDVFKIWNKMFPQYRKRIAFFRSLLDPHLETIRRFRNKTAFHAESAFESFFEPRVRFQENSKAVVAGVQSFLSIAKFLVKRELLAEPDLYNRFLSVIFNTELQLKCTINRKWLTQATLLDGSVFKTMHF